MNAEKLRLKECRDATAAWKKWGPYLSERQWGTVREDYSPGGDAWSYFSHDQARSRAYRWGEDGIAGVCDDRMRICLALALWNGRDPILKERLFGLTNSEGNHGEDVKEYYFYVDSTPTHSYMKYLYRYPQAAYPYADLVTNGPQRSRTEYEYELIDTGVFAEDRYFDLFVEYAKEGPEDLLVRITARNCGPDTASLHLLPTLWFRNRWSWGENNPRPELHEVPLAGSQKGVLVHEPKLGDYLLACEGDPDLLFTENETNHERISGAPNPTPFVKDGINNFVVQGCENAVNPEKKGTKVAAMYRMEVPSGETAVVKLRLTPAAGAESKAFPGKAFDAVMDLRKKEADEFYGEVIPSSLTADESLVMRQALAGMLWSKQFYYYDVDRWLEERGCDPFKKGSARSPRNDQWHHMYNGDIISMPDKWEYPWYAAWDLAFHVLAITLVDPDFGKEQLNLMLRERYLHPNGQIPAYEWNFSDVNPPVHAWSAIFTYNLEKGQTGVGDREWLKGCFQKLLLNFTWWVNRKDRTGRNVFEGGFLGLDNIGVFDRSSPLPTGGCLEQADGTAWMALFCENMLQIASELALTDPEYVDMCLKFVEHFLWIASAMGHLGDDTGMWDDEDGFFYDVLRLPDGTARRLKVRSMVGLLPLCAVTVFDGQIIAKYPEMGEKLRRFLESRPELRHSIHDPLKPGVQGRAMASILDETRLRRVLSRMLDESEFLSPYGIRSLSRYHAEHPFRMEAGGREYSVGYLPAESDSGMFGGNSNWRGPIWMPVNALILRALIQYHSYFGEDFRVECPTGSGQWMSLFEVAKEIGHRLTRIFLLDDNGRRPVFGGDNKFQTDPRWLDYPLFYEYFHGDNGAGLGASHQTGWTGIIARILHVFANTEMKDFRTDRGAYFRRGGEELPAARAASAAPLPGNRSEATTQVLS